MLLLSECSDAVVDDDDIVKFRFRVSLWRAFLEDEEEATLTAAGTKDDEEEEETAAGSTGREVTRKDLVGLAYGWPGSRPGFARSIPAVAQAHAQDSQTLCSTVPALSHLATCKFPFGGAKKSMGCQKSKESDR